MYLSLFLSLYMCAVELLIGPSLAIFKVIIWAELVFLTLFVKNIMKIGASALFYKKKFVRANFQSY